MNKRSFRRPLGERRYKKFFFIATEGSHTEPQYFALFNGLTSIFVKCLLTGKNTKSAPLQILKKMKVHLKKEGLKSSDEAWLVVDKDAWEVDHLRQLMAWEKEKDNYGLALSNPNFEYWLLLHFEEGKSNLSAKECLDRLRKHLPNYCKKIDPKKIAKDRIEQAIRRAKQQVVSNKDVLDQVCRTSVYKLVDKILDNK